VTVPAHLAAEQPDLGSCSFAHGLVHTDSAGYEGLDADVFEFDLGSYSNELQVWLYDPDFNGSSGMMPRDRRRPRLGWEAEQAEGFVLQADGLLDHTDQEATPWDTASSATS
jgi:hypothetical protein